MLRNVIAIIATGLLFSTIAFGGWQTEGEPVKIAESDGEKFTQPRWSPNGQYIAFGGSQYKGLWILDVNSRELLQVSDEQGAGFDFQWSPDGEQIVARVTRFSDRRRNDAIMLFSTDGSKKILQDYRTGKPGLPQWNNNGTRVIIPQRKGLQIINMTAVVSRNQSTDATAIFLQNGKITRADDTGKINQRFDPFPGKRYLNTTVSPDGQKIAFEVIGGNLYSMNLQSQGVTDLGPGHRPQWAPDSRHLAYMISVDDGHHYLSADIYIVDSETKESFQITNGDDKKEMSASWSPDGQSLVYDTIEDGAIYVQKLRFESN